MRLRWLSQLQIAIGILQARVELAGGLGNGGRWYWLHQMVVCGISFRCRRQYLDDVVEGDEIDVPSSGIPWRLVSFRCNSSASFWELGPH